MSVITLSQKEAIERESAQEGTVPYGAGTVEPPDTSSSDALDKVISGAVDKHYRESDPAVDKRGLDKILSDNIENAERKEQDVEAFRESLPDLQELGDRYASDGDVVETVSRVVDLAKAAKQDPRGTAPAIMEAYGRLPPWLPEKKNTEKATAYVDPMTGHRNTGKVLDDIITLAQDNAGLEEKMAGLRAELKSLYPHLKFNEAIKMALKLDDMLRADPAGGAARFAAMNGIAWTPRQLAQEAELDNARNVVHAATAHLPGLQHQEVRDKVSAILGDPQFVTTGDAMRDLANAYQAAAQRDQQHDNLGKWAEAEIAKMPPALGEMVQDVLMSDPNYRSRAGQNPQVNLGIATAIAQEKLARLAKARKARRASTSTGVSPRGGKSGGGLDAVISSALSGWGD